MEGDYTGMTVNERLFAGGYLPEFDNAVKAKDVNKIVSLLKAVGLSGPSIDPILERLGLKRESRSEQ
jgi:hypothetical protein